MPRCLPCLTPVVPVGSTHLTAHVAPVAHALRVRFAFYRGCWLHFTFYVFIWLILHVTLVILLVVYVCRLLLRSYVILVGCCWFTFTFGYTFVELHLVGWIYTLLVVHLLVTHCYGCLHTFGYGWLRYVRFAFGYGWFTLRLVRYVLACPPRLPRCPVAHTFGPSCLALPLAFSCLTPRTRLYPVALQLPLPCRSAFTYPVLYCPSSVTLPYPSSFAARCRTRSRTCPVALPRLRCVLALPRAPVAQLPCPVPRICLRVPWLVTPVTVARVPGFVHLCLTHPACPVAFAFCVVVVVVFGSRALLPLPLLVGYVGCGCGLLAVHFCGSFCAVAHARCGCTHAPLLPTLPLPCLAVVAVTHAFTYICGCVHVPLYLLRLVLFVVRLVTFGLRYPFPFPGCPCPRCVQFTRVRRLRALVDLHFTFTLRSHTHLRLHFGYIQLQFGWLLAFCVYTHVCWLRVRLPFALVVGWFGYSSFTTFSRFAVDVGCCCCCWLRFTFCVYHTFAFDVLVRLRLQFWFSSVAFYGWLRTHVAFVYVTLLYTVAFLFAFYTRTFSCGWLRSLPHARFGCCVCFTHVWLVWLQFGYARSVALRFAGCSFTLRTFVVTLRYVFTFVGCCWLRSLVGCVRLFVGWFARFTLILRSVAFTFTLRYVDVYVVFSFTRYVTHVLRLVTLFGSVRLVGCSLRSDPALVAPVAPVTCPGSVARCPVGYPVQLPRVPGYLARSPGSVAQVARCPGWFVARSQVTRLPRRSPLVARLTLPAPCCLVSCPQLPSCSCSWFPVYLTCSSSLSSQLPSSSSVRTLRVALCVYARVAHVSSTTFCC